MSSELLTPGTRFGPYAIVCPIGAGGMGEVYRATDTNLKRQVAIKVLPEAVATDPERLARFQREAEVLAALNHPNIAAIYGLEKSDGHVALVMELVEGDDLSTLIQAAGDRLQAADPPKPSASARALREGASAAERRGWGPAAREKSRHGLALSDALPVAKQILEALEAAHARGIIHRDLKPANVKVRADGMVKVLDFGLAKAMEPVGVSGSISASMSPTITSPAMTQVGMILGTAAYMSPEQAKGQPADRRSDVWAFGAMLYEVLTGRRAFEGDGISDTMANVLKSEPDWSALPPGLSSGLVTFLRRALEKDPKQRIADVQDMRLALEGAFDVAPQVQPPQRSTPWLPWAVAGVLALLSLPMLVFFGGPPASPSTSVAASIALPADVEYWGAPAISADGSTVALIGIHEGRRSTYVRRLNDFATQPLDHPAVHYVSLSPDGQSVAIVTLRGEIMRLSVDGRVSQTLVSGANILGGVHWTRDDHIIFDRTGGLTSIASVGGDARRLTTYDDARREMAHRWPIASTDGRFVFFTSDTVDGDSRLEVVDTRDGSRSVVEPNDAQAIWASPDRLVFVRDGDVFSVDVDDGQVIGLPTVLMSDVTSESPITGWSAALSDSGTLVVASAETMPTRLFLVSEDGTEQALTREIGQFENPQMSPDGRFVVYNRPSGIWRFDLARETHTLVGQGIFPVWVDSSRIAFTTANGVAVARADGEGEPALLPGTIAADYPASVSPDGTRLAVVRVSPGSSGDVVLLSLDGTGEPEPFVSTAAYEGGGQFSPDGRWMLYTSDDETDEHEVYIRRYPGGGRRWPVSAGGGIHPLWRGDGRRIFYRSGWSVFAVDVELGEDDVTLSSPTPLFEGPYKMGGNLTVPNYSIAADGARLIMIRREPGARGLGLITNWLE